jgi:hypothetical protein
MEAYWNGFYSTNQMDAEIKINLEKDGKTTWLRGRIICLYHTARNKTVMSVTLTYSLTQSRRGLLEKLTGFQLVKKFPAFYGTWRYLTALTSACHLSRPWASSIQSLPPHPTSWRSNLILSSHLNIILPSTPGSPKWSLSFSFPHQNLVYVSPHPHTCHMPCPSHSSSFYHSKNVCDTTDTFYDEPLISNLTNFNAGPMNVTGHNLVVSIKIINSLLWT